MTVTIVALLVAGLVLLVGGAEAFVRGASRLAAAVGISPLVIGLTVVAFGTSSPEIAVSVQSAYTGSAALALGNVIGSNICNILLILGLSAAVAPLYVSGQLIRLDVPVMIAVSFLVPILGFNGALDRLDGILLLSTGVGYTTFLVIQSRRETKAVQSQFDAQYGPATVGRDGHGGSILLMVIGLGLLVLGSRWLVSGAVTVAELLGVSELVIGLTVVAIGTSLPELATSIIAALRGERDIAVGNIVGSNIYNILLVLGVTAAVAPLGIPVPSAALRFDLPVMLAVSVACLPIFFNGNLIDRWEGLLFFGYYVAYTGYLVLASAQHEALPVFSQIMQLFVIPLTAITLIVITLREWKRRVDGRARRRVNSEE